MYSGVLWESINQIIYFYRLDSHHDPRDRQMCACMHNYCSQFGPFVNDIRPTDLLIVHNWKRPCRLSNDNRLWTTSNSLSSTTFDCEQCKFAYFTCMDRHASIYLDTQVLSCNLNALHAKHNYAIMLSTSVMRFVLTKLISSIHIQVQTWTTEVIRYRLLLYTKLSLHTQVRIQGRRKCWAVKCVKSPPTASSKLVSMIGVCLHVYVATTIQDDAIRIELCVIHE